MKTVLAIFGGKSPEYEVSLTSAASVISNIPSDLYKVLMVGITRDGRFLLFDGDIEEISNDTWHLNESCKPAIISPDAKEEGLLVFSGDCFDRLNFDVAFPILHGKYGEDGAIQGLFELADIAYVGCDLVASAVCMDKVLTNTLADSFGIRQAAWLFTLEYDYNKAPEDFIEKVSSNIGYPCFVKPANAGSSVGISKVNSASEMQGAMENAFLHDTKVLVEEGIDGLEVECAVLGNDEPIASVTGQIIPGSDFYDYKAKYIDTTSQLLIPAEIPEETAKEIQALSIKLFKAFCCKGLSRVDFFVGKKDGLIYFNEINTLPGFTPISMYPKLFERSGIAYSDLLDRLIKLAIEIRNR